MVIWGRSTWWSSPYHGTQQQRRDLQRQRPTGGLGRVSGAVASNGRQLTYSRLRSTGKAKTIRTGLAVFKATATFTMACTDLQAMVKMGAHWARADCAVSA